jgi:hypothetical protein
MGESGKLFDPCRLDQWRIFGEIIVAFHRYFDYTGALKHARSPFECKFFDPATLSGIRCPNRAPFPQPGTEKQWEFPPFQKIGLAQVGKTHYLVFPK